MRNLLLTLLYLTFASPAAAENSSELLLELQQADAVKRTDFAQFSQSVQRLSEKKAAFTGYENTYFMYLQGYHSAYAGELKKSIYTYKNALSQATDAVLKYRISLSLSNVLGLAQDYAGTLEYLDVVLQLLPEIEDRELRHTGYLLAAATYQRLFSEYELAQNFSELVLADAPSESNKCIANESYFGSQMALEALAHTSENINQAIEDCKLAGEYIYAKLILADVLEKKLEFAEAAETLELLKSNWDQVNDTKYVNLISMYKALYARAYWQLGEYEQSRQFSEDVLSMASGGGNPEHRIVALNLLHQYHDQKGEYEKALERHRGYVSENEKHRADLLDRNMAFVINEHSAVEKSQRIELLNKQNELLKVEKLLAKQTARNTRLFIALLIIVLALIGWWLRKTIISARGFRTLAEYDQLTQVFTRGHFQDIMISVIEASKRKNRHFGFVIFDLDNFKNVNDQYGHLTGDWVLKKVIQACKSISCRGCTYGRLGGEEFAILIENGSIQDVIDHCEKCRIAIAAIDTSETTHHFDITASFGITSSDISGFDYKQLLSDADQAMYQAKHNGRNQWVIFSEDAVTPVASLG